MVTHPTGLPVRGSRSVHCDCLFVLFTAFSTSSDTWIWICNVNAIHLFSSCKPSYNWSYILFIVLHHFLHCQTPDYSYHTILLLYIISLASSLQSVCNSKLKFLPRLFLSYQHPSIFNHLVQVIQLLCEKGQISLSRDLKQHLTYLKKIIQNNLKSFTWASLNWRALAVLRTQI